MKTSDHKGVLVMEPEAYMDLSFKKELLPVLQRYVDEGGLVVLVDCSGVELINSHGISALLSAYDQLEAAGGALAFAGVGSPIVENALEISGLASFCEPHFYASAEEALDVLTAA